jgi:hypothetical protein
MQEDDHITTFFNNLGDMFRVARGLIGADPQSLCRVIGNVPEDTEFTKKTLIDARGALAEIDHIYAVAGDVLKAAAAQRAGA